MKRKDNFWPRRLATVLILGMFLFGVMPLVVLPVPAEAHHVLSVTTNKAYYIQGKEDVVFSIKNNGNDAAHNGCTGVWVYDKAAGKQVAYELTPLTACTGEGYNVPSGQTHTWNWDQKDNWNKNPPAQVPIGTYYGSIKFDDGNGNIKTYQTSDFLIEGDSDGDGVSDTPDLCDNEVPKEDANKDGCDDSGDSDGDGIKNNYDDCPFNGGPPKTNGCPDIDDDGIADCKDTNKNGCDSSDEYPDKCTPDGGPLFPRQNYAEDNNDFKQGDGCPDEGKKRARDTAVATTRAIGYGHTAAAAIAGAASFGIAGAGFALLEVGYMITADYAYDTMTKDPPDTVNYSMAYALKSPSDYFIHLMSNMRAQMNERAGLVSSVYLATQAIEGMSISMDRHSGAIIMEDYAAAGMQAKKVREYAALTAQLLKGASIETDKLGALKDPANDLDVATLRQAAAGLRQKLLSEGVSALPEAELEFVREEGLEQWLPKLYELSVDEGRLDKITTLPEYYKTAGVAQTDIINFLDEVSKTFGANLYLVAEHSAGGVISVSVHYENAPNAVKQFAIEVVKPSGFELLAIVKDDSISDWSTLESEIAPDRFLVSGFSRGTEIAPGASGHLVTFKLKPAIQSANDGYEFTIGATYLDLQGWLTTLPETLPAKQVQTSQTQIFKNGAWVFVPQPTTPAPQPDLVNNLAPMWDGMQWLMAPMPAQMNTWAGDHWELGPVAPMDSYPRDPLPAGQTYVWTGSSWILADADLVANAPMPSQFPVYDVGLKQWVFASQVSGSQSASW